MFRDRDYPISIPTWEKNEWIEDTIFNSMPEFIDYLKNLFKEPGKYEFDETVKHWQDESIKYNEVGYYCEAPLRTKDFIHYWDDQKRKARTGVIYKSGDKQWFLSRDYYFWLNFLPIFDKEKNIYDFPLIWDIQYHMALYELLAELNNKHSVILKKRQIASEQPHSEPILGEHGWTTMGEVQPGDKLWNPDGTLTTILHKSNNGISDVYEFEFIDGRKTRCGIEHNWEVYDRTTKKIIILNTRDLLKKGINKEYKSGTHYRFAIKNTEPIEFKNTQELPIDPYVLGCILGDGSIGSSVYISGKDNDIFDEIQLTLGDKYKLTDVGYCKKNIVFKERFNKNSKYKNVKYGVNPLLRELDNLGLRVNNKGIKFIPEIYLNSSILDRICLIQGLMDTDGYINSTGNNIHFTNKNKDIIDGLAYICRSLGIKVTISEKTNRHGIYYRLLFSGNIPFEIFRLSRKQNRLVKRWGKNTFDLVPLISIKKLDYKEESSCIVVDNPNHLYITRDFIVTHNSYFHCAKLINYYWFEEGAKLKMGASLKDYINLKGSWKMLNEYSDFLNEHTAWIRPHNPGKVGDWEQKIQKTVNGRDITVGLKSTMGGYTFEKDATAGVGGPCRYFFHEEAGVAPKMDETYEFMRPALHSGMITTGMFIAAGSVGDLDQCEPLKEFIMHPEENDFYAVESNLIDDEGTWGKHGLFLPEQWSMPPYIDEFGNSQVEEALKAIHEQREEWKKNLDPSKYQLRISQKPTNIKEAFAFRNESKFPLHLLTNQQRRIDEKKYHQEYINLKRGPNGNIIVTESKKSPIKDFPIKKNQEDKEGCIVVWERPIAKPEHGTYYASVDPVSEGKTTTSESLCSIYVYKNTIQMSKMDANGDMKTHIEEGKIVAAWCGRFDDINKTHERLELLIEWYNAWTIVENNISLFIQHMIAVRKQKYLVPKDQILFLKNIGANKTVYQDFGWKNTGTIFKSHMLSYVIEMLNEKLDVEEDEEGNITNIIYGVERIPDPMLIKEMSEYHDGLNVDRLVSFAALVAFVKIQESNKGYKRIVEYEDSKSLENSQKMFKLNKRAFSKIGTSTSSKNRRGRSGFKNIH